MERAYPFVVTVASEKGGVGKTTIATNLAVYLKALREDLPVTIASFDNHFSVDQMFAIGSARGPSIGALFSGVPMSELARLGEYGVQFVPSDPGLVPPDDDVQRLRRCLGRSGLGGILILDTRPILDYFTRNALVAADLVLAPVKDRPSLVNIASLQKMLGEAGEEPEKLWLIPSLVDARLKLRQDVGVRDFLTVSARERGYQVLETFIAKSPKVEGLTTSFANRVHPVITHARGTVVHQQFRDLASFALELFDGTPRPRCGKMVAALGNSSHGFPKRLLPACPVCGEPEWGEGRFFQDLRSRRCGYLHDDCLNAMMPGGDLESLSKDVLLVVETEGAGLCGSQASVRVHMLEGEGREPDAFGDFSGVLGDFLRAATGRPTSELYREFQVILPVSDCSPPEDYARLGRLRRPALRSILQR